MAIATSSDFISKFHNLDGDLVGERKKSLFVLLKDASQSLTHLEIDVAIENLDPKTYQERLFWVETLVYFKKVGPLMEILKNCNREHIKIVVRQKWFIETAFQNITPTELVYNFFPCVSYSTRLKLLGRIPNYWSEEKNDDLFDRVHNRYGLYVSLRVLHKCSTTKIQQLLKQQETLLNTGQILYLLNKNEDLFATYLDYYNNWYKKPYSEKNVLNIMAVKRPDLFTRFKNNNYINPVNLTASATAKLVTTAKQEILSDPHRLFNTLHARTLVKTLGSDVKQFLTKTFPKKFADLNSNCDFFKLFKYFPKSTRWGLFSEMYQVQFPNRNLEDFYRVIDQFILTLNPSKEVIFKWAEIKYKSTSDDNFLTYYPPSTSTPMLKEKINVTSDMQTRQGLLKLLIKACAENEDSTTLEKVLEYIGSRHRNEEPHSYKRQIEYLVNSFKEEELTEHIWKFVHRQIIAIRTQGTLHFYDYKEIVVKFLEYSYKNERGLFEAIAANYLKDGCASRSWNFRRDFEKSKLEREIFIDVCKLFPAVVPSGHQHFRLTQKFLIDDFVEICKAYPEQCMNLLDYPYFVSAIDAACDNKEHLNDVELEIVKSAVMYNVLFPRFALPSLNESKLLQLFEVALETDIVDKLLLQLAKKKNLTDLETKIISLFLDSSVDTHIWYMHQIVESLLLHHPRLVLANIAKQWLHMTDTCCNRIKHYSHIGLDKIFCDYLVKNWSRADVTQQETTVNILLMLLPEEDFIKFCDETVLPSVGELNNEDDIKRYKVQCHLAGRLKTVVEPPKYLPLLMKFCAKDYLDFALPSLYSVLAGYPEKALYSHIEFLFKHNLSVQKHGFYLSCEFLERDYVSKLLENAHASGQSVLKILCLTTLRYFIKTDFDDMFALFKRYLSMFDAYDKGLFSDLAKIAVPKKYRAGYVEICWEILEKFDLEPENIDKHLDKLLQQILDGEIVKDLSATFVEKTIGYLSVETKRRLKNINRFTIASLVHRESERNANYKYTFDILTKLNKNNINLFCNNFIETSEKRDAAFLKDFVQRWKQNFSLVDTLDEHIILNLLTMRDAPVEIYAKDIVDYLEQLLTAFGHRAFEVFCKNFRYQINRMQDLNKYELFRSMLMYKTRPTVCVLVLQALLPVSDDENEDSANCFKNVLETIKIVEEPVVKCYYEIYLNDNINNV